jgi:hypothetical protein
MRMPAIGGTDRISQKKTAARVCNHPAAEAYFDAAKKNNCIRTASTGADGFPNMDAFNMDEWETAFPGQAILPDGCPNRPRMAMHWARAMIRAVAIGDFVVAAICQRGMHCACSPNVAILEREKGQHLA